MRTWIAFALLTSLAILVACGGGEPAQPETLALTVNALDELRYDPPSLTIPSGANVELTFNNTGVLEHNWVLVNEALDIYDTTLDIPSLAIGGAESGLIAGSATNVFTFTAPPPGQYLYVCSVSGHAATGMVGELTVTP